MTRFSGLYRVMGAGVFWMITWALIGAGLSLVVGIVHPPSIDAGEGPVDLARILGGVGAISGLVFGFLLLLAARHTADADVAVLRAAALGLLAGAIVGVVGQVNVMNTCLFGFVAGITYVLFARAARRLPPITSH